jgi:hypothetical protein
VFRNFEIFPYSRHPTLNYAIKSQAKALFITTLRTWFTIHEILFRFLKKKIIPATRYNKNGEFLLNVFSRFI